MMKEFDSKYMDKIFGTFFESSPDIFFIFDFEGTILDYRASRHSELYVPPEVFIGKTISEVLPPNVNAIFMDKMSEAKSSNRMSSFLYDLNMPSGLTHYECRLNCVADSDFVIAVIRNVTEEQESIRALAESEKRFKNLLEQAPFPVIVVRMADGVMRYLNARAQKQLGFEESEGVGLCVLDYYTNAFERDQFTAQFLNQGFVVDHEIQLLNGKNEPYWALVSASQVEYEGVASVMLSINVITERKEAELALKQEKFLLNERLKERECLLKTIELTHMDERTIDQIFEEMIFVIKQGWKSPDKTLVSLVFNDIKHKNGDFLACTNRIERSKMTIDGQEVYLAIGYMGSKEESLEDPFLPEEYILADTVIEILIDMLNRRKRIATVQEQNELVDLMFEHTREAVALYSPVLKRFTSFNSAAYKGLGYTKEAFLDMSVEAFQYELSHDQIEALIEKAQLGEQMRYETKHRCKNGDVQDAVVTLTKILHKTQPYLCFIWRDVTEQNRSIKKLKALSSAVEQSPVSIVITDLNGYIEYANPKACMTTGYSLEELIGQKPSILKSGDTSSEEYEGIWEKIVNGYEWKGIFHNKRKNGELYWESSSIAPIVNDQGKIIHYLAVKEDITERKQIQDDLLKFRTILEQASYGAAVANMDEILVYVNPSYAHMHGWEVEDVIGKSIQLMYSNAQWPQLRLLLDELKVSDRFISNEVWRTRKDGSTFPSFMSGNLIYNDKNLPEYIAVSVVDVTDLKQKEYEIQKLKVAIEQSPVAAVITDLEGIIEYASPAFEKTTGYLASEVVGMHTRTLKSGLTSDNTYKDLWQTISSGNVWEGEWINKRKDGELYHEFASITPICNFEGRLTNYLAIKEDITKQKQAEKDRIDREAADAANQAKSAFLSSMSHEIRTPLNAIIGFAQLLDRDSSLSQKQSKQVQSIVRSSEHLMALINDILDLSRIEAGHTTLNMVNFNLHDLIDDIAMMFQLRFVEKNVQLLVYKDKSLPLYVAGDEAKIRQILINLVGNALKFTDVGSVALRAFAQNNPNNPNKKFTLSIVVEDTGPGISVDDQSRIFSSFYQTKMGIKSGGTGLGLSISKNLVELMGGSIMVFSSVGVGSSFSFNLPMHESDRAREKFSIKLQNVLKIKSGIGPFRVLIADDRVENREILKDLLESVGFETHLVTNGQEAVNVFESWHPHAILLDMSMPILDGYETAKIIRANLDGDKVLIVAVTASVFESDIYRVMDSGVNRYIRKPFKAEEIFAALEDIPGLRYMAADFEKECEIEYEPKTAAAVDLPADLIASIKQAILKGDIATIRKLILEVKLKNEPFAKKMQELVTQYDYDALLEMLDAKRE